MMSVCRPLLLPVILFEVKNECDCCYSELIVLELRFGLCWNADLIA